MRSYYRYAIWSFLFGTLAACTQVKFEALPNTTCEEFDALYGSSTCELTPDGKNTFNYSVKLGNADILFVIDNSGSMSPEHELMANRFNNFISLLFSQGIDYRIAITTTDVTATPGNNVVKAANGNGLFQDGKLLKFSDSNGPTDKNVIDTSYPINLADDMFINTVVRQETLDCEASGFLPAACPSDNERGIYAANLALNRNESAGTNYNNQSLGQFIRPSGHLAFVFLADEDERSGPYSSYYTLQETNDLPETLVHNFQARFPLKSMSVHSIVVPPQSFGSTATQCINQQRGQFPFANSYYGEKYGQLSDLNWPVDGLDEGMSGGLLTRGSVVEGYIGNVCASDYLNLVNEIADRILTPPIKLACDNPEQFQFQTSAGNGFIPNISAGQLTFNPPLPAGVTLTLSYKCPR